MKLLRIIGVFAFFCAVLPLAAGAVRTPASVAAAEVNTVTFQDSTQERPDAPDITTVVVSNTNTGELTFKINGPARLTDDMLVGMDIDSDNNPATGDPESGADYAIELFRGEVNLFKWDGTTFSRRANDPPQTSLTFSQLTIRINASELGGTTQFGFDVIVITGIVIDRNGDLDFTSARADIAPDFGHGLYKFQVKTAPLRLVAKSFSLSPRRPSAGRTLTASMVAARNDTGATLKSGQVVCTARIGGVRIAARVHRFVGTQARCAWQIPSSTRGKSIRGSITVLFEGKRVSRSFAATVG